MSSSPPKRRSFDEETRQVFTPEVLRGMKKLADDIESEEGNDVVVDNLVQRARTEYLHIMVIFEDRLPRQAARLLELIQSPRESDVIEL